MAETRQQLKERLQAAGKWDEYLAIREQLTAQGMTPAQARSEALEQVEARRQTAETPSVALSVDALPMEGAGASIEPYALPDFARRSDNADSVEWVAQNLANPNVRPEDCPSGMAWGLLEWVRFSSANKSTFWTSIWPKLLPTGSALKNRHEPDKSDDAPLLTMVDDLIAEWKQKAATKEASRRTN